MICWAEVTCVGELTNKAQEVRRADRAYTTTVSTYGDAVVRGLPRSVGLVRRNEKIVLLVLVVRETTWADWMCEVAANRAPSVGGSSTGRAVGLAPCTQIRTCTPSHTDRHTAPTANNRAYQRVIRNQNKAQTHNEVNRGDDHTGENPIVHSCFGVFGVLRHRRVVVVIEGKCLLACETWLEAFRACAWGWGGLKPI